ncbi:hypothetical protein A3742_08025 [Oleiphilus sp. HI0071]|nr:MULTISPECIES: tRNA lysidine(34) synthetase TilS [unclassified Oleiphilus]KZY72599.1 hypothetical protein A3737_10870 [Oleiphilus sp. HI0065]KZY82821.1 hypothetical protein A3742_08025 [Oleiphilus sp. HI0071]KZZ04866.1 hypothetical protein A3744_09345 [Oleiphilus sp. HI0073]KZZ56668.1 hypothetical protein A3760_08485 [Oleiphilus sp. HI0122]KZZ14858.1 hypothetical protein A3750_13140 [Oleiphilus sp. HI0079]
MIKAKLERAFASYPDSSTFYVAYSGGLDSTVLLHLAKRAAKTQSSKRRIQLKAIHVHHGISAHADRWSEHCRAECERLDIPLIVERVSIRGSGGSFERAAREARYAAFNQYLSCRDVLLMAHHEDDQFETILMRLMRRGDGSLLAGIPESRELQSGVLFRPFLNVRRADLERYAVEHNLKWVEDDSNKALCIARNRIRHQVLPKLQKQEPQLFVILAELVHGHRRLNALSSRLFKALYPKMCVAVFNGEVGLSLKVLRLLEAESQRDLLRWWLRDLALAQPTAASFERVWNELIPAKEDAQPRIDWAGLSLRRYADAIFVVESDFTGESQSEDSDVAESWGELGKREKIRGFTKKQWQKRLRIPPWQRPFLKVRYGGSSDVGAKILDVIDMRNGRSIFTVADSHIEER